MIALCWSGEGVVVGGLSVSGVCGQRNRNDREVTFRIRGGVRFRLR